MEMKRMGVRDEITGKKAEFVVIDEFEGNRDDPAPPPRRLSNDANSPDFHECYIRVGLRIDGVERNDIAYYDMDNMSYMTTDKTSHLAETMEPYWRYQPSRQQRRREEAWERKHKK